MRSRRSRRTPAVLIGLATAAALLSTGCSADSDCAGTTYDVDLGEEGSASPIDALDLWLDTQDLDTDPPVDGWVRQDDRNPDAETVVIVNDGGDGWWVSVRRTDQDGWVVEQATDDATACGDKLAS